MICLVGEAWGSEEERLNGVPFIGPAGVQLIQLLADSGLLELSPYDKSMLHSYWIAKDSNYIALLWKAHPEFHCTNVFKLHPPRNDLNALCTSKTEAAPGLSALTPGKYLRAEFLPHVLDLYDEIEKLNPDLIIALGNTACWALMGQTSISKIRGVAVYCNPAERKNALQR